MTSYVSWLGGDDVPSAPPEPLVPRKKTRGIGYSPPLPPRPAAAAVPAAAGPRRRRLREKVRPAAAPAYPPAPSQEQVTHVTGDTEGKRKGKVLKTMRRSHGLLARLRARVGLRRNGSKSDATASRAADCVPLCSMASKEGGPLPAQLATRCHLPDFVQRAASEVDLARISRNLGLLEAASTRRVVTIGTFCSGSEMYMTCLPHLQRVIAEGTGKEVTFQHLWSCECSRRKREWIWENFGVQRIFCDVADLWMEGAHDDVTQARQEVLPVDVLIAGFSCKDASRLNPHHTHRLNAVERGTHTTGGTFHALMRLLQKHKNTVKMVILENVPSLADKAKETKRSSLDSVREAFHNQGFAFLCRMFDALDVGMPNRRPRLYSAWLSRRSMSSSEGTRGSNTEVR